MSSPPDYVERYAGATMAWFASLMHAEHFGLFRACRDAVIDWDMETSAKALEVIARLQGVEALPGWSVEAQSATARFVADLQQADSGWFVDPHIEALAPDDLPAPERVRLRQNKTKYAQIVLRRFGAEPRYPCTTTGDAPGLPDADWVLDQVRHGRDGMTWENRPNSVGNFACAYLRELFELACQGHAHYLEAVQEGLDVVLAKQNPVTGMWGTDGQVSRAAQVQAALKIIGRLKWSFGLPVPFLEPMADRCIEWHADRSFYHHDSGGVSHCDPRNAAEMIYVCLLDRPDYRGDELRETMRQVCDYYHEVHGTPDGAYSRGRGTEAVVYNKVARVAPVTETPRGDLGGTNGASYTFGMANHILGWGVPHLASPHQDWASKLEARPYQLVLQADRTVAIEEVGSAVTAG